MFLPGAAAAAAAGATLVVPLRLLRASATAWAMVGWRALTILVTTACWSAGAALVKPTTHRDINTCVATIVYFGGVNLIGSPRSG